MLQNTRQYTTNSGGYKMSDFRKEMVYRAGLVDRAEFDDHMGYPDYESEIALLEVNLIDVNLDLEDSKTIVKDLRTKLGRAYREIIELKEKIKELEGEYKGIKKYVEEGK